jgi:hypothetical protein
LEKFLFVKVLAKPPQKSPPECFVPYRTASVYICQGADEGISTFSNVFHINTMMKRE